jgi:predicted RNA-binding protein YlxR (DUF448 family)
VDSLRRGDTLCYSECVLGEFKLIGIRFCDILWWYSPVKWNGVTYLDKNNHWGRGVWLKEHPSGTRGLAQRAPIRDEGFGSKSNHQGRGVWLKEQPSGTRCLAQRAPSDYSQDTLKLLLRRLLINLLTRYPVSYSWDLSGLLINLLTRYPVSYSWDLSGLLKRGSNSLLTRRS